MVLRDALVSLFTFGSVLGILVIWLRLAQGTILWVYSISITSFLIFMYAVTRGYRPVDDLGYRPRITVVIPAKDEEDVIESVIKTVFQSDYPSSKMDIVAVDDGSTDRTWERMQSAKTHLVLSDQLTLLRHDKNYGKRAALASAIAQARGEIIVCIDSDSFVERDAIRLLVQPLEDPTVTGVCGHGEAANKDEGVLPRLQHYWYSEMFRLLKGMESRLGTVSCCSGMLAAYRRTAILPLINQWLAEKKSKAAGADRVDIYTSPLAHGLTGALIKSPGEDRILTAYASSGKNARVVYQSNAVVRTIVPVSFNLFLKQQLRWNRAWIHGSVLAARFMWRKHLTSSLIFYLYQFVSFLSPAVVVFWLLLSPFRGAWVGALGFLAGTLFIGFLHGLNTWNYRKTTLASVPYRMMFVFLSLFLTMTVLLYGWLTPWKMGWITRTRRPPEIIGEVRSEPALLEGIPASAVYDSADSITLSEAG